VLLAPTRLPHPGEFSPIVPLIHIDFVFSFLLISYEIGGRGRGEEEGPGKDGEGERHISVT